MGLSHAATNQMGKTSLLNDLIAYQKDPAVTRTSEYFEEEDRCVLSNGQIDVFFDVDDKH